MKAEANVQRWLADVIKILFKEVTKEARCILLGELQLLEVEDFKTVVSTKVNQIFVEVENVRKMFFNLDLEVKKFEEESKKMLKEQTPTKDLQSLSECFRSTYQTLQTELSQLKKTQKLNEDAFLLLQNAFLQSLDLELAKIKIFPTKIAIKEP